MPMPRAGVAPGQRLRVDVVPLLGSAGRVGDAGDLLLAAQARGIDLVTGH